MSQGATLNTVKEDWKWMPRDPSPEMLEAIEAHFRKWQAIIGYTDDQVKAQAWDALQTYHRLFDAAKGGPTHRACDCGQFVAIWTEAEIADAQRQARILTDGLNVE